MGKCAACGRETDQTATVYIGTPTFCKETELTSYDYQPQTEYLCSDCVVKRAHSSGKSGFIFYLALQLCWFSVAKNGLFSPLGLFGAAIGVVALMRIVVLLARFLLLRLRPDRPLPKLLARSIDLEVEASDIYQSMIQKEQEAYGRSVMSLREYRRRHKS